jgi:hypothetical protein
MNDDVTELTDEYGATLTFEDRRRETGGILLTVKDETTAAIVLSYEQVRALANALIDAGF